jgi:hypothetical protein
MNTFAGCTALAEVVIGSSVKTIESYAFLNCPSLKSITIPASVAEIKDGVFSDLQEITFLGKEAPTIAGYTFPWYFKDSGKIYVPKGTASRYKIAWSSYADIIIEN